MALMKDWMVDVAEHIHKDYLMNKAGIRDMTSAHAIEAITAIFLEHCPFKRDVAYMEVREPPLLQCVDCQNTESPAGAMARAFNHGRCMHCGGHFKVVRA